MLEWFIEHWKLVAFILNCIFFLVVWAMSRTFAKKDDVTHLTERVSKIESSIIDMPGTNDFHELDKSLIEVSGKLDAVMPQLDGLKKITEILMENELRGKS